MKIERKEEIVAEISAFLKGVLRYTADASLGITLLVGLLLVLKYTTGPDHLAAVTTLIASERERRL